MTRHEEKKFLPFQSNDLFALVADIEAYPEFLPWCVAARIREKSKDEHQEVLLADLVVSFAAFRERFGSRVLLDHQLQEIHVDYLDGPFKVLKNHWKFNALPDGTEIEFFVEFEFKSRILQLAIGQVFEMAMKKITTAFELRAAALFDPIC